MKFTPQEMRKRFHLASAEAAAIRAKSDPVRAERDALSAEADATLRALNERIRAIEAPLYDLDCERGLIARALSDDGKARMGKPEDHCTAAELEAARASVK